MNSTEGVFATGRSSQKQIAFDAEFAGGGNLGLIILIGLAFLITSSMGTLYLVSRVTGLSLPHADLKAMSGEPKTLAILVSGPRGWMGFDHQLAESLTASGMDVMGIDYLRYFFWKKKTPTLLAEDLSKMMRSWMESHPEAQRFVLLGYSKGADVLPFAVNLLDAELRSKIQMISLVSVSRLANFSLRLSNLLMGGYGPFALKVGPEIKKLDPLPTFCIYGNKDLVSLCRNLKGIPNVEVREIQGGHYFQDAKSVADLILRKYESVSKGYMHLPAEAKSDGRREIRVGEFRDAHS